MASILGALSLFHGSVTPVDMNCSIESLCSLWEPLKRAWRQIPVKLHLEMSAALADTWNVEALHPNQLLLDMWLQKLWQNKSVFPVPTFVGNLLAQTFSYMPYSRIGLSTNLKEWEFVEGF